jgi:alpha-2-macroglobulin
MKRQLSNLMVCLLAFAASCGSCGSCGGKKNDKNAPNAGNGSAGSGEKVDDAPKRAAITPQKLQPMIHELGVEGVVPTSIVIELATPVIERERGREVAGASVLKIKPEIAGTLMYTGPSELTFTPATPFEFDKTYEVELTKLDTADGVLEPPAGQKWTYSFKTPSFKFLGWAPTFVDLEHHKVTMEATFSGPVLPNLGRTNMTFSVDGAQVAAAGISAVASHTPNTILIQIADPHLQLGSKVAVALAKDFMSVTGARAPAARSTYVVSTPKIVSIKTARLVEGANGFYLEVVCDDQAAAPGNRSYYEDEGYYQLSQRCQLTDEAIAHVHFNPPVKKPYITAGRSGFRVFGEFARGAYSVKIDANATSMDGGIVAAPFARSFAVPARKPHLAFAASGRYLPRSAWNNLGIKHLNVDAINLVVRQVPQENLVFWLGNTDTDAADERTSDVILKKTIPLRGDVDTQASTWLDVASLLPAKTKGILELKLVAVGAQTTSRILLTNMSLVAKKTSPPDKPWKQTVTAWALDIESADLMSGVDISLVRKSGKVVGRCTTSGASGCTISPPNDDRDPDQAEPFALIARRGDDLTYIRYTDLKAEVAESSTAGVPYVAATPYHAAVYADRGVYRPGETAHVVAIVRDPKERAPDQPLPVDVKVLDPRAKIVRKQTLNTNTAGVITLDHAFPAFADTGHWRVQLSVADKPLAAYDVLVEEFVPERMKVSVTPKQPQALLGSKVAFDVSAVYLFGGNAIDSGVELQCALTPTRFAPKDNADLVYGIEPKGKAVQLGESRDQLSPLGTARVACADSNEGATTFTQTAELTATTSVLEAGSGRATVKTATVMMHPESYYLGLRTKTQVATAGTAFAVDGLVVDWNGKALAGAIKEVDVELLHMESDYGYGYDDYSGESRYDRYLRTVPEGRQKAPVGADGKFHLDITPGNADVGYMVRVTAGKAKTELVLAGSYPYDYYYGYGDGGRVDQTPRPARATQLRIELPKEIKTGESVNVKTTVPYKGKVLWTVETDHVVTSAWKDATSGEATWSFKLDQFAPNVYVSAFVVKDPHAESKQAFLPDRAFGIGSIRVVPVEYTQPVRIIAPKDIRSSSSLTVQLELGADTGGAVRPPSPPSPTYATVAVVDEGILQLTNFTSPDPLTQLFGKRALGVETYETLGWTMLHQPAGASSKTGGGDSGEMDEAAGGGPLDKGRAQPIKPVALFSGVVQVGPDGKAAIPFQIPTYRGQLRVMAITASATKIGRAEMQISVRDPVVVQVTFPRFVTQNDELQIPVFLTNLSGRPLDIAVSLDSQTLPMPGLAPPRTPVAPLAFLGKSSGSIKLDHGRGDTLVFRAKANMPVGAAKLVVTARAGGAEYKDSVDIPFLPAGPKDRAVTKIKVPAGTVDLAKVAALKNWMPNSESTTFWLTNNPYGESFQHLSYLIHYPYGCIEQTTSSARPLLYVGALAEQVDPQLAELKIEDMVISGINRIFSMEAPGGGFAYWPGGLEATEWGTAYATHFLLDAKQAGYAVPEDRLKAVLAWIDNRVSAYERGDRIQKDRWNHYDEEAEAYLQYVLARAGKGKKARIQTLISRIPADSKGELAEGLYMLKAALYLAGDRRFERDLKNVDASPIMAERINDWSFYSDRRRRGFMLATFFDLFGNDPAGEKLAQRVAENLSSEPSYYYSTQELVWGVTGLGKWVNATMSRGAVADGKLTADGVEIKARVAKRKTNDKTWALSRASEYRTLTLDVPASAGGMWLVVSSEGVRPNGEYKVGGNGLSVSRTYRKLDGTEIDPSKGTLKLGDLVFVELEIENTSGSYIQNIAFVDRLPAGFEIENPRLGRSTKVDWAKDEDMWAVDFMNMRDDRLEAFGALAPKQARKLVYTVRAVTSGKFAIPPVEAEAMYDPTQWARAAGGVAVIGGPWTGKTI